MKPEHLEEATKLTRELKVLKEQYYQLTQTDEIRLKFFNRELKITNEDPRFIEIRRSAMTFLDHQMACLYRHANQIGLHLEPVVTKPAPVTVPLSKLNAEDIAGIASLDDQIKKVFKDWS